MVHVKAEHIYPAAEPKLMYFPSRRSTVHSTKGIVASTQPLANECGLKILRQGGNCADAAVAVAAALNMTEPSSTGIGGDMFCLFYKASDKKVYSLNGSGRSGLQTSREQMRKDLGIPDGETGKITLRSAHAVTVPGAAAGWVDVIEKFGSGRLGSKEETRERILKPAIELGEEGFPVSELSATFWGDGEEDIRKANPGTEEEKSTAREMLKSDPAAKDGYRAPRAGEIMKNPTLANTFRLLAEKGKPGFYEGEVAEQLVQKVQKMGGHLTLEDLKHHADTGSEDTEAISLVFNGQGVDQQGGVELWEHPPNGQGIVALMALGMLEELEKNGKINKWKQSDHNSVEHLHAAIEVLRIAFADASWHVSDPNVSKVPIEELISREYLAKRAKLFDPEKARMANDIRSPAHNHSDTVYFAVTDAEGNGISFINSNYTGFGTAIIPKGCGFTLQNRGANFSLEAGHPNEYAPRKRPYHTIIPAMLTNPEDGSLHSVLGVMGGFMQPQGHVQTVLNMLVFGLTPQAALDAPRFCIGSGMPSSGGTTGTAIYLEEGIDPKVIETLREKGHDVVPVEGYERGLFGKGQIIRRHEEDGQLVWSAGSDLRGDGAASPA